ncbi:hypothetical protein A3I99_04985 [Candidatus Kaiserbacteria bacterium RIFCSPLOWO2_02_FULL_45_11b]|uniref:Uncharacterized protein n=1 Tax=Candidatus Kaiserbacteria bacterium RIFCSPLOWO2_12_FULL_45_26 TaxID=1798525 RepID=A0A1F6FGY3_9BACT|nr:MAG: hypothetical protein A2929_02195 [Candidatus Kaiserbacteria bacterium RIFCSPLOWO2_01_FULL_45_25]OGG81529.1 MAG: hypothetical protein A3I99_04985 [Candidatus Kaiserbacteria bacterium RIFCSPLOWO2_02_FULL_45_11b]OGG85120.1 MAG: hypothetical protein A3G90_03610 [Candidatus Kaiserbacteria bacterium RIFCSPLOWO2_12_FULL_45_26]
MSTCRFCSLFRFWSKFLTALLLLVAGSQFSVWVNNHQVEPKYQEPLSAKQQAMKDAYLAARLVPEILVTKDGTKLYYNSKSHQAEVKKPAWLGDSGEIVLTVFEKWDIAREGIVTEKIFGLETKSITVADFKIYIELASFLSACGLLLGMATSLSRRDSKSPLYVFYIGFGLCLVSFYFFLGTNTFLMATLAFTINLAIGLLLWPTWSLIDWVAGWMNTTTSEESA